MPNINLSILNQRQTPAFFADTLANRPAPSFVGRIFISTDTYDLYRDTGTAWVLLSPSAAAGVTGTGVSNQVAFWSGTTAITGENNLWWDSVNDHFGIGTNTPATALDIHHNQSTLVQLNQTTATNDTRITFQNNGNSKWRVGNFYSGGSHDYKVSEAFLGLNRFTIKSISGQTFVGNETSSSGLFVINSNQTDSHLVVLGSNSPSIRVRNAGVGASLQFGLGLATFSNNFIQGTTGGEMCVFNDSLSAQPILFGIKNGFNTNEAARISNSLNLLVGTSVDSGEKLQISGTALATSFVKSGGTSSQILAADGNVITAGTNITISGGTISSSGGGGGGGGNIQQPNFATAQIINFFGSPSATYDLNTLFPSINFTGVAIHLDMQLILRTSSGNYGSYYYNLNRDAGSSFFVYGSAYQQYTSGSPSFPSFIFGGTEANPTVQFYLFSGGFGSAALTLTTCI